MQFTQTRMVPNFTDTGFKVIQAPPHLHKKLYDAIRADVYDWDSIPYEEGVPALTAIYNPDGLRPKFVSVQSLASEVSNQQS